MLKWFRFAASLEAAADLYRDKTGAVNTLFIFLDKNTHWEKYRSDY